MNPFPLSTATLSRRQFLVAGGMAALAFSIEPVRAAATRRFFSVGPRNGRWWFVTPEDKPFFSIALNHIDPAPLRYTANGDLWARKYGNSMERWLKEAVAPDLQAWGFNSVGWTQEVVTRGLTNHRHSRAFTFEEYQWLGLPYCHQLPFADFHQWEVETRHPDFHSAEFAEWCDYVAREHCARMAGDPKLIGYFYIDCPTWIHTRPHNEWKGPLFDPEKLKTDAGRRELTALATKWYQVTHDAIRRYDKHHLILGDRYEASLPVAEEVVRAALPYVDVLSFQHFKQPDEVAANLRKWHDLTGKPVLLADQAVSIRQPDGVQRHDGAGYAATLEALRGIPGCVGYHLCGAYLRNTARNRALRAADEAPDTTALAAITAANREAAEWMKTHE
ncbi:MAG: agarase [Verrucomicrobia bacterium]|nr:agarase [Verrucomicrobiota bacterium]